MYDLSVEGSETFLAGFGGLIVHNTFTVASAIAQHNKPTLVLAHNKTLAAQLYAEFREFFPENAVEYFVSYFDYYQPEAYLPAPIPTSRRTRRATTRSTASATPRRTPCSSAGT